MFNQTFFHPDFYITNSTVTLFVGHAYLRELYPTFYNHSGFYIKMFFKQNNNFAAYFVFPFELYFTESRKMLVFKRFFPNRWNLI
jgi:hypothetical protein